MNKELQKLEDQLLSKKDIPEFWPGDEIEVHIKSEEGEKEKIHVFSGTCIARKGKGINETFTVRKESYGEGVEKIFLLYSPNIKKIEILKPRKAKGLAPRAKMYYLRETE